MLLFSSSNPETFELFRATYYRPKLVLLVLLFVAFPSTDRTLDLPPTTTTLSPASSLPPTKQIRDVPQPVSGLTTADSLLLLSSQTTLPHDDSLSLITTSSAGSASPSTQDQKSSTPADQLNNPDGIAHQSPRTDARQPGPVVQSSTVPSCPDAYLDYRNNIICPHAPKRLKSVRQRFNEVIHHIQNTLKRCLRLEVVLDQSRTTPHPLWLATHPSISPTELVQRSTARALLCTPVSNPFLHLVILLHVLFFIQAMSLLIEDALIKEACSSARPTSFRRSSSWRKIWSRFRFRFRTQWSKRAFFEPFAVWLFSLGLLTLIVIETLGETGSWYTGQVWHDLPFRSLCSRSSARSLRTSSSHPMRVSIIRAPALKFLSFLLDRPPFLKPARSLVLIECFVALVSLLQPTQHILPRRIMPAVIRVPERFLSSRHRRHQSDSLLSSSESKQTRTCSRPRSKSLAVEVETRWLLGVFVEGCVCIGAIASYGVVMVHLPYASHYSIPFLICIYSIKSFSRQLSALAQSTVKTIECLESVLERFSSNTKKEDWICSICFEEEEEDISRLNEKEAGEKKEQVKSESESCCLLSCGHGYHAKCLVKWLHYQTFCPICHRSVSD